MVLFFCNPPLAGLGRIPLSLARASTTETPRTAHSEYHSRLRFQTYQLGLHIFPPFPPP